MNVRFGGLYVIPTPEVNSWQKGWDFHDWRETLDQLQQCSGADVFERQEGIAALAAATTRAGDKTMADILIERGQPFMYLPVDGERSKSDQHCRERRMLAGTVSSAALTGMGRMR